MKKKRKISVFKRIFFPLLAAMIIQSCVSIAIIEIGQVTEKLSDNYAQLLQQISYGRKNEIENSMVSKWGNITDDVETLNLSFTKFIAENNITINEFVSDKKIQRKFTDYISDNILDCLESNGTTGAYIVLADKSSDNTGKHIGLYFRDSDNNNSLANYKDILMERGSYSIANRYNISLDSYWTTDFDFSDKDSDRTSFYYKPYNAALENVTADISNLGYWSNPFLLNDDNGKDANEVIAYSVPLIKDGVVYGVMGVEIASHYIQSLLPISELNYDQVASYALVSYKDIDNLDVMVLSGNLLSTSDMPNGKIAIEKTQYNDLYHIKNTDYYLCLNEIKLYNLNGPFSDNNYALAAITTEQSIFGVSEKLTTSIIFVSAITLGIGICVILFTARLTTKPIKKMVEFIKNSNINTLSDFKGTN